MQVELLAHPAPDRGQQPAALGGGQPAPVAVECRLSGRDRGIDVGGAAARDRRQIAAIGRVDEHQAAAVGGRTPLAADQQLGGVEGQGIGH